MRLTQMKLHTVALTAMTFAALAIGPTNGFATALPLTDSGILQIANLPGSLVGVTTAPPCINWSGGATCPTPLTSTQMGVSGSSNLFSTATSATDTIKNIGGTTSESSFETVLGAGALAGQTIIFDLTSIPTNTGGNIGNCTSNAANNSCTPAGSPFTFAMDSTGTQLTISFSTLMNAYTGTTTTGVTGYKGLFATQQSGTFVGSGACSGLTANITDALSCEAAGGTIDATWSATESPVTGTPEPLSFVLFGTGLVGLAMVRRYRRS